MKNVSQLKGRRTFWDKFPVLHDKTAKRYKEKDAVNNPWTTAEENLDFVEDCN